MTGPRARFDEALDHLIDGQPLAWVPLRSRILSLDELAPSWEQAVARRGQLRSSHAVKLYAHFAYCEMHCTFCQYWHAVTKDQAQLDALGDHIAMTMRRWRERLGRVRVSSAYFGGGTPTALPSPALSRLLAEVHRSFDISGDFTCEAHPATLDEPKLALLADSGVTRLSMGVQTFDEAVLERTGRRGATERHIGSLVRAAQHRGLAVNLDLMVGLPGQTMATFERDLDRVAGIGPDTIVVYRYRPTRQLPNDDGSLRFDDARSARERVFASPASATCSRKHARETPTRASRHGRRRGSSPRSRAVACSRWHGSSASTVARRSIS